MEGLGDKYRRNLIIGTSFHYLKSTKRILTNR